MWRSVSCVVRFKEVILKKKKHWLALFGSLKKILVDNRDGFANKDFNHIL